MLAPSTNWEFEGFRVLTEARILLSDGTPVPLTSKAFDTLAFLIANRERVVTKDELLRSIWPDVVVEEGNLTQQIFLLRKALGETAHQPRYIVTIPGHGYRFAGNVREVADDAPPSGAAASSGGEKSIHKGYLAVGAIGLVAVVLGAAWLAKDKEPVRSPLDLARASVTKVTDSGKATDSAMSADGRYLAYVENDGDEHSVWVTQISGGKTQVVPRQTNVLSYLSFSPNGEYLYFARATPGRGGFVLFRVPSIGGLETPILDNVDSPVSFSPDGRQFVFMRGAGLESHIVVASAAGDFQKPLASRAEPLSFAFVAPDWSPDGTMVSATVVDRKENLRWSIVVIPLDGSPSRDLYKSDSRIGRTRWLPDGKGVLTVVSDTLSRQFPAWQAIEPGLSGGSIWRIRYPGGEAERLTSDLAEHDIRFLDIAEHGAVVATVVNSVVSDLWLASADRLDAARQLTWDHRVITRHAWMPNADTIVYRDMSGRLNAIHTDGRAFSLSIPDGHYAVGGVSVCGDGRYVVFHAVPGNNIWRVTPTAGGATMLTSGFVDSNPACSQNGQWVVYSSLRANGFSLWRVPIEGGEPTPVVEGESFDALPSPSGRLIYYSAFGWEERPVRTRVTRWIVISSDDRKRLFSLDEPVAKTVGTRPIWAPDESGLDYVVTRNGVSNIWRLPLTGGNPVQITNFSAAKIFSFAWSPDGRWLSLGSGGNRSDVIVMRAGR